MPGPNRKMNMRGGGMAAKPKAMPKPLGMKGGGDAMKAKKKAKPKSMPKSRVRSSSKKAL